MPGLKKRIAVIGSSGSIGTQTLDVCRKHHDKLDVVGLAVHTRVVELAEQVREFGVAHAIVGNEALRHDTRLAPLADAIDGERAARKTKLGFGMAALLELIHDPAVDLVVNAMVGAIGLRVSYETLRIGKVLALANKESLVVGGDLIMPYATHETLMPIDSEHGALYQCLLGEDGDAVTKLWVTASGGPFRGRKRGDLAHVTPEEALAHPTWNMGAKITIDSSTLMNKGLEVIEAHHLFAMGYDEIEVVVQPQSAIHSMVEFNDGSVKAHLGTTDMRIPIQFALSYPDRWDAPVTPLDFRTLGSIDFAAPDTETFGCLSLAYEAGRIGGTMPCVMNAANEVAVAAFLGKRCSFLAIESCIASAMEEHGAVRVESLEHLEAVDAAARVTASRYLEGHVS